MRITYTILFSFIILIQACKESKIDKGCPKKLDINVESVWMMEKPLIGAKLKKLVCNTNCEVLERGEKMILNGMEDYWYKIKVKGKKGWIFGSETSLNTGIKHTVEDFHSFFNRFLKDSYGGKDLNVYLHQQIGIYGANNPGAFCTLTNSKAIVNQSVPTEAPPLIFNKSPKGHYCDGFSNEESGFYIQSEIIHKLPFYSYFDKDGNLMHKSIKLPKTYNPISYKRVTVIINEQFESHMYFANIDYNWYLVIEDLCDCSA